MGASVKWNDIYKLTVLNLTAILTWRLGEWVVGQYLNDISTTMSILLIGAVYLGAFVVGVLFMWDSRGMRWRSAFYAGLVLGFFGVAAEFVREPGWGTVIPVLVFATCSGLVVMLSFICSMRLGERRQSKEPERLG